MDYEDEYESSGALDDCESRSKQSLNGKPNQLNTKFVAYRVLSQNDFKVDAYTLF